MIEPNKSLGQHWLADKNVLQQIVDAANITPEDEVVEIGPGTGTLTRALIDNGAHVTAVEFDRNLVDRLQAEFPEARVVRSDILSFDLSRMKTPYKIVANIPYYLTSKLIRLLSESANPPERAVLLIQKEVAQRVAAAPGDMSLLGVSAQYYWEVSLGIEVPAKLFTPPPKVDSQVVILNKRQQPPFGKIDEKKFFRIVKAGFSNRRKTLLNSLSAGLHLSKENTRQPLENAGIKPSSRAQELSLEQWHTLYKNFA
ncbi:MAG: 16S rRNA (adenine(1518)-N(6)/adenine(1519)-N(6))-dimethyltransferase RsmA [Candidatus Saccharibacteria bacterium]|nr:16S rRNA (adenine(1518)-N(6)/adenine(1519)-N(6))-dimethyltransferase RsmA [Candidatus Saccharibacteria bacterium]